jgi:hypothetical protein
LRRSIKNVLKNLFEICLCRQGEICTQTNLASAAAWSCDRRRATIPVALGVRADVGRPYVLRPSCRLQAR